MACQHQWFEILAPMTGQRLRTGLRWAEVDARSRNLPEYRALSRTQRDQVWKDLEVLQSAALAYWANEQS